MQTSVADQDQSTFTHPPFEATSIRQTSFAGIISQCRKMQKVFAVIEKVARTDSTVLLLEERVEPERSWIARSIHKLSGRSGRLVPVNCGAIPEDILESELFGHEKGSFTGAVSSKVGRFQLADGGTIFLDEIGEMSPKLQVKLLRVLQERKIDPVGSTKSIELDVRIVAATNKDLREEVRAGRFREDLYYRLQVVPIELPALRDRGEDVELLARYFMTRECSNLGREELSFSSEAMQLLKRFGWPGNVRELENIIQRLAILAESEQVEVQDLPSFLTDDSQECAILESTDHIPDEGLDFNDLVNQFEAKLIRMALGQTNWNKKAAARLLKLNRTTLVEKIKKKGLEQEKATEATDDPVRPEF